MNIYVGNLSWDATEEDLGNLFNDFGQVQSAKIIKDKRSGKSKGFGFVEMGTDEEANAAINELNSKDFMGRKLVVNEARPPRHDR